MSFIFEKEILTNSIAGQTTTSKIKNIEEPTQGSADLKLLRAFKLLGISRFYMVYIKSKPGFDFSKPGLTFLPSNYF
jgi:hypothetical protein